MSCVICCDALFDNLARQNSYRVSGSGSTVGCSTSSNKNSKNWEDRPSVLRCGHVFHQGCISAWLAHSNRATCPTCRSSHTGDPISIYFEAGEADTQVAGDIDEGLDDREHTDVQVQHRNEIIKTLCANVESAHVETKKTKKLLRAAEKDFELKSHELKEITDKLRSYREKFETLKKAAEELRKVKMKHEKTIADQAHKIEEQQKIIDTVNAELVEQKRVVTSMGDVRTTNEQLARQLKKERSRVHTLTALNAQLASRISFSAQNASNDQQQQHLYCPNATDESISSLDNDISFAGDSEGYKKDDVPSAFLVTGSDTDQDADLIEDAVAVSSSVVASLARSRISQPQSKRVSTFEVPLASFESSNFAVKNGTEASLSSAPSSGANPNGAAYSNSGIGSNPFVATTRPSTSFLTSTEFTFVPSSLSIGDLLKPSTQTLLRKIHPTKAIKRPSTLNQYTSDGLGGSRRRGNNSSVRGGRGTQPVQAKINWGSKKA